MLSTQSRRLFGRRVIYTEVEEINEGNILEVLEKAYQQHTINEFEIDYLYRYYKGEQPILYRKKEVRPDINNKVTVNIAHEVVSFKTGYRLSGKIQYVNRTGDDSVSEKISKLNSYMVSEGKEAIDKEMEDWANICGTSYRICLPDIMAGVDEDEAPFEIYASDPRYTFVVYSADLGNKRMMGVRFMRREDGTIVFSCWTENDLYFEIDNWKIVDAKTTLCGTAIVEYPQSIERMGAFEPAIPQMDAINTIESNRLDGIEQFVQAYWKFVGCKIDTPLFEEFKRQGAIMVPPNDNGGNIDVDLITKELNQDQIQTAIDDLYNRILTIVGMPNRNGGSSTSDTGKAVVYRDGWSAAETRAKSRDALFEKSEREFLKMALRHCDNIRDLGLKLSAIDIQPTRQNYANFSENVNSLIAMLGCDMIAPEDAYASCNVFPDSHAACRRGLEWHDYLEAKAQEVTPDGNGTETKNDPDTGSGSGD